MKKLLAILILGASLASPAFAQVGPTPVYGLQLKNNNPGLSPVGSAVFRWLTATGYVEVSVNGGPYTPVGSTGTVTSISSAFGVTLTPNPIVATGTVAVNQAMVPTWTGAHTFSASPTWGADNTYSFGDTTHRAASYFSLAYNSGVSSTTFTTTVPANGARDGFIFNDTNIGNSDRYVAFQAGGVDAVVLKDRTGAPGSNVAWQSTSTLMSMYNVTIDGFQASTGADNFFIGNVATAQVVSTSLRPSTTLTIDLGDSTHVWVNTWSKLYNAVGIGAGVAIAPSATTGTPTTPFLLTPAADTSLTAGANIPVFNIATATRSWATGAITEIDEVIIHAPTLQATAASTATKTSTFTVDAAPTCNSNMTCTSAYALWVQAGITQLDGPLVAASATSSSFAAALKFSSNSIGLVSAGGNGIIYTDDNLGTHMQYGAGNSINLGTANIALVTTSLTGSVGTADGATAINYDLSSSVGLHTAGAAVMRLVSTANSGIYLSAFTGDAAQSCAIAVDMLADTAGITAGEVVVWTAATGKAANAGATNNLTTIAGVAITSAASTAYAKVCIRGRAKTNADAAITAGQLVGTSAGTAGNVQSGTPPGAGAIVGRAIESTGSTTANKVYVDVNPS